MERIRVVTNADEIYFYFEMLKNVRAQHVLDVGMFLKRIGAIARQAMSCELPVDMLLYGIDFFPETEMAVYQKIYNEIWTMDAFVNWAKVAGQKSKMHFDVAVMLETDEWLNEKENAVVWEYILQNANAVMTNVTTADSQVNKGRVSGYYPVSTGAGSYAWIPLVELGREG